MEKKRTYKIGDLEYLYDDLKSELDYGVRSFINSRSDKDYDKYFSAYSNIMQGLGDNSLRVINDNGVWKFVDDKGRYQSKRTYKLGEAVDPDDYYSIMASYVFPELLSAPKYTDTSKSTTGKYKYKDNSSLGLWVLRDMLGNNSDINDFIRLDLGQNKTGGREKRIALMLKSLNNLKKQYKTYFGDEHWVEDEANIGAAIAALSDGDISDEDYITINKALGYGTDLRNMFITDISPKIEQTTASDSGNSSALWLSDHYPEYTQDIAGRKVYNLMEDARPLGDWTLKLTQSYLSNTSADNLKKTLYNVLEGKPITQDSNYRLYLRNFNAGQYRNVNNLFRGLIGKNALQKISEGKYVLPHRTKKGVYFLYDSNARTLTLIMGYEIPEIAERIRKEYKGSVSPGSSAAEAIFGVLSAKNGAVLKFGDGGPAKYDNALSAIFYDVEDLMDTKRLRHVKSGNGFALDNRNDVIATHEGKDANSYYDEETVGLGSAIEAGDLYKNWLNILTSNEQVANEWATQYRSLQKAKGADFLYKNWFNDDGSFNFENFKKNIIRNGKDTGKTVYRDEKNGIGHDLYRGRAYNVKGTSDFYSEIPEGYELTLDPTYLDESGLVNVYTLTKKSPTTIEGDPNKKPTEVIPGDPDIKPYEPPKIKASSIIEKHIPDLMDLGRLAGYLRTNNRVADVLKQIQGYKVAAPYKYHYQEGAYGILNSGMRGYANTMNLANSMQTSDALVNNATMLDTDKSGWETKMQPAILADDLTILKNRKLAEEYADWSNEKAIEARNMNAKLDSDIYNLKLEVEANRLKSNNESWAQFLAGMSTRMRDDFKYKEQINQTIDMQSGNDEIRSRYRHDLNRIKAHLDQLIKDGKYDTDEYRRYERALLDIQDLMREEMARLRASVYNRQYVRNNNLPSLSEIRKYYLNNTTLV